MQWRQQWHKPPWRREKPGHSIDRLPEELGIGPADRNRPRVTDRHILADRDSDNIHRIISDKGSMQGVPRSSSFWLARPGRLLSIVQLQPAFISHGISVCERIHAEQYCVWSWSIHKHTAVVHDEEAFHRRSISWMRWKSAGIKHSWTSAGAKSYRGRARIWWACHKGHKLWRCVPCVAGQFVVLRDNTAAAVINVNIGPR